MKQLFVRLLMLTAFLIGSSVLPLFEKPPVYAGSETLEDQVARILIEESSKGKIKVVIFDFSVSSANTEKKLSEGELKDTGARFTEEFIANIINKIKDSGKRDNIAIIDRGRLDDILREKKLPVTDTMERSATDIGGIAGLDVIITGRVTVSRDSLTATAKVVRVKDGEILSIARQDRQGKPTTVVHTPITIIDAVEKINIGDWKALPLNLAASGTLDVTISVVHGNPIDVYVMPGPELDNFKNHKEFKDVIDFMVTKTRNYKRSADLSNGDYYLVLRDSSLGIFSTRSSDVKITVQLKP